MVAEAPVGKTVPVTVLRNGKEINLNVRIEEMTEQRMAEEMQAPSQTFGMTLNNLTPQVRSESGISDTTGVAVVDVQAGSIADQAGIRPGDVIKEVNHHPVKDMRDFDASMKKAVKGQPVLFLVKRGKQVFFVTLESSE
jgi:serine protease Do